MTQLQTTGTKPVYSLVHNAVPAITNIENDEDSDIGVAIDD